MNVRYCKDKACNPSRAHQVKAFSLVEVLLALCVVLIGLLPLIHLHVVSIRMVDSSARLSRATLIANAKLAEIIARGFPELGTSSGRFQDDDRGVVFRWSAAVTDTRAPELEAAHVTGLRAVRVDVAWENGQSHNVVSLHTLVRIAEKALNEASGHQDDPRSGEPTLIRRSRM